MTLNHFYIFLALWSFFAFPNFVRWIFRETTLWGNQNANIQRKIFASSAKRQRGTQITHILVAWWNVLSAFRFSTENTLWSVASDKFYRVKATSLRRDKDGWVNPRSLTAFWDHSWWLIGRPVRMNVLQLHWDKFKQNQHQKTQFKSQNVRVSLTN